MPRIARIITRLNLGGPARQLLAMTPLLQREGFETHILCGDAPAGEGDLGAELRAAGAEIHRIPSLVRELSLLRDLSARRQIGEQLERIAPDLVHTHMAKAGWLGRQASLRRRLRPMIHTFHGHLLRGYFGRALTRVYVNIERRLARRTDRLVCVSLRTLDDLVDAGVIPPERSGVIRPGIEAGALLAIDAEPLRDPDAVHLLFTGRLVPVKRPERFLDLVAALRRSGRDVRGRILGDGPLRAALERRARAEGLSDAIEFLGLDPEPAPVLARCDALVSTSENEGLPVAILEAFAAARPVVAMDVGGIAEIVEHGRDGLLVPPGDLDGARAALERLIDAPEEARAMGRRGRVKVRDRFSAERLAAEHLQLYRRCLEEAARGGA